VCRAPLAPLLKRDPGPLLPYLSIVSGITDLYMPSRIVENFFLSLSLFFKIYIYIRRRKRGEKKKIYTHRDRLSSRIIGVVSEV